MKASSVALLALAVALSASAAPVLGAVGIASWGNEVPEGQTELGSAVDSAADESRAVTAPAAASDSLSTHVRAPLELSDKAMDGVRYHDTVRTATGPAPVVGRADVAPAMMEAPAAPQTYDHNHSHNGSVGSGTWDWTNHTLTVTAGNFSWHGINCSWSAFNWTKGDDFLDLLNITCDFWGLFTITFQNGNGTITWANGSWNWSWGAPPAPPEGFDAELMRAISSDPALATVRVSVAPVQMPAVSLPKF